MAKHTVQSVEPNIADLVNVWLNSYKLDYKLEQESLNAEIKEYSFLEAIENTYKTRDTEFITAWGKLYKKEIFNKLRYKKALIHEDEQIIHRVFSLATKVVVSTKKLYYYFQNSNSIIGIGYNLKRVDLLEGLNDRAEFLKQNYPNLYKESFATFFVYRCIDLYYEIPKDFKEKKEAKKQTLKYFKIAYKGLKNIKSKAKKRFIIFKFSPTLYRRLFRW